MFFASFCLTKGSGVWGNAPRSEREEVRRTSEAMFGGKGTHFRFNRKALREVLCGA